MPSIRLAPDDYKCLQEYADGRPLGKTVRRLLDSVLGVQHATEQVRDGKTLTHDEVFPSLGMDTDPPAKGKAAIRPTPSGENILLAADKPDTWKPTCTCPPAELRKGKHNKHCPAK